MACAAGTLYRNYFAPVSVPSAGRGGGLLVSHGQTREHQINNLDLLARELNNAEHHFWDIENGYR